MNKFGNEIKRIVAVDVETFLIEVEFVDGAVIDVPVAHVFAKPKGLAAEVLRGGMFSQCFVESGAVAWPNGLGLCPDAMRMWASERGEKPARKSRRA